MTQNVQLGQALHVKSPTLMNIKIFYECLRFLVDAQPDTCEVDRSEIRTQILLATASSALKGGRSFTHMLTEVRQAGRKS